MRTFEHFPQESKCPLCGESTDKPCTLIGIDGTSDGSIEKAIPVHVECLHEAEYRINQKVGIIYTRVEAE